ncbi:hypothetical protein PHYBLDRAFT_140052 [Phycomyces blakesleeanus NRRL 1555(-)]|uniref:Uncharacterized protein n=1 Tax=Phycomyces blakesleeanus (strain ATCC 8743b / DSM 1359 / FGSC 10004 / NBRC 33097 / NRRL 1555) TaxID=763407 RepID=A0A167QPW6_PHYB8|nr:hypothetical protein PHYBLDRAFT_140052 [Phycomyces blakesleeanus NRRL 1555(-)]OAD80039.1 hypothetical protein PHYBLDRAFT_140052 [Phycomyces blakesleeanus NRRL 1555(-)]|eukprot:XP_018298079.1 hypothetical protein PHYBLDRAFT_140052 [Phycomyces blakesleeanus NRRL 1555(-)]
MTLSSNNHFETTEPQDQISLEIDQSDIHLDCGGRVGELPDWYMYTPSHDITISTDRVLEALGSLGFVDSVQLNQSKTRTKRDL